MIFSVLSFIKGNTHIRHHTVWYVPNFLRVVGLLEGRCFKPSPAPLAKTWPPGVSLQVPTPGLATGWWGPSNTNPSNRTALVFLCFIRGFGNICRSISHKKRWKRQKWKIGFCQSLCLQNPYNILLNKLNKWSHQFEIKLIPQNLFAA